MSILLIFLITNIHVAPAYLVHVQEVGDSEQKVQSELETEGKIKG